MKNPDTPAKISSEIKDLALRCRIVPGFAVQVGSEIILVDSDKDISRACIALLNDPERCETLGAAIQDKVYRAYNPERIISSIADVIKANF